MVREHDVEVLVILAPEHGVMSVDFPREQGHAFVLHGGTIQGDKFEMEKIRCFDELREDGAPIISGVSGVIGFGAVLVVNCTKRASRCRCSGTG